MSVFSNKQIRQAIANGHIVCHPFNDQYVNGASLDITLGYHYYRIESNSQHAVYNPLDARDVERYFNGPHMALPHGEWCELNGVRPVAGIPEDHPIIALNPGEHIIAHTHEFLGMVAPGAYEIRGKSAWALNGITVSSDGSWIEPGTVNRMALRICNSNQSEVMLLPVGERIAQAVFYGTGEIDRNQVATNSGSGYRTHADLETIIKTWSPSSLLPQAYLEPRNLPLKIEGVSYE